MKCSFKDIWFRMNKCAMQRLAVPRRFRHMLFLRRWMGRGGSTGKCIIWQFWLVAFTRLQFSLSTYQVSYRPYAYDVTEGRPRALGVKRSTATCVIAKHAARGATPACHTAGLARLGPRTERLSANAHCQHNTCALRDATLVWRRCYGDVTLCDINA